MQDACKRPIPPTRALASGMTAPHRLKDLADVIEVIRILELPAGMAEELDPYVRKKYRELWSAAQTAERE